MFSIWTTVISIFISLVGLVLAYIPIKHALKERKNKKNLIGTNCLLEHIKNGRTMKVGYFHYPPFVISSGKSNAPSGYYVELIKLVAIQNKILVEWIEIPFGSAISSIEQRIVDLVLCIFQTPFRTQFVDFTAFLHSIVVNGVTRKGITNLSSLSDLQNSNFKIAVAKGEIGEEILQTIKFNRNRMFIIDSPDMQSIITLVQNGTADLAISNGITIFNYFKEHPESQKTVKPIFRRRPLDNCLNGIMISKNESNFANWLDTECKRIREEDTHLIQTENEILEEFSGLITKI